MNVYSAGRKLIPGLMLMLFAAVSLAESNSPANFEKPGVDLSSYTKVLVKPLNLNNIEVLKPAWEQDNPEVWTFDPGTGAAVQQMFMEAMKNELEVKGGYAMVHAPAKDVLLIEIELLSITPYVKPGTKARDGNYEISTLGSGEVFVSAELRDSKTRELLILVEGERPIGEEYKKLSYENHVANLKGLFAKWGKKVREKLDAAHGK